MATTTKGDNPTPEQQAVIDEIARWIDTDVIARAIAEEIVDEGYKLTVKHCQDAWYHVLEEIHQTVRSTIRACF